MSADFGQSGYDVRFEWGAVGAVAVAPGAAVVVVVDLLSFTTTLTVAVERGISVLPFPWRDRVAAAEVAAREQAVVAAGRSVAGPGEISLSPPSLTRAPASVRRLVLPSPNGSAISSALAAAGVTVVGASLRNFPAAAAWVRRVAGGRPIAVVASGERWPDDSLRPAAEDLWAAGAFLDAYLSGASPDPSASASASISASASASASPEAGLARAAYRAVADRLGEVVPACGSGRELVEAGFGADVAMALEAGVSSVVPVLRDGWFVDGGSGSQVALS